MHARITPGRDNCDCQFMYSCTALLTNTMFSGLTSLGGVDLAVCMILPDIFMGALMPSLQSGGIGTVVPGKKLCYLQPNGTMGNANIVRIMQCTGDL